MAFDLELQVEALIFASEQSISLIEIHQIINSIDKDDIISINSVETAILQIRKKYENPKIAISLTKINDGYQFLTKAAYHPLINKLEIHRSKKKLSQAALETLSIIAYRQPITKLDVEQIRGVNCDYSIQRLLERELVQIIGKSTALGKPLLYGVSQNFMDYFGINSMADLPKLNEIVPKDNSVGDLQE